MSHVIASTQTVRRFHAVSVMRRVVLAVLGAAVVLPLGTAALAFWTAGGDGAAAAATGSLSAPTNVVADAPEDSGTVAVSWDAATLGTGQAAQGYFVTRIHDTDGVTSPACGTSAASPTAALSCDDLSVADGTYHYRVTAVFGSWTAQGLPSASVTVVNDSGRPEVTVTSISPTPNGNGYNNSTPVVVNLSATDAVRDRLDHLPGRCRYAGDSGRVHCGGVPWRATAIHTVTFQREGQHRCRQPGRVRTRADRHRGALGAGRAYADRGQRHGVLQQRPDQQRQHAHVLRNRGGREHRHLVQQWDRRWAPLWLLVDGTYTVTATALSAGAKTITVPGHRPGRQPRRRLRRAPPSRWTTRRRQLPALRRSRRPATAAGPARTASPTTRPRRSPARARPAPSASRCTPAASRWGPAVPQPRVTPRHRVRWPTASTR